jgi:hypothetical protein
VQGWVLCAVLLTAVLLTAVLLCRCAVLRRFRSAMMTYFTMVPNSDDVPGALDPDTMVD